jgi:hypothetical protein
MTEDLQGKTLVSETRSRSYWKVTQSQRRQYMASRRNNRKRFAQKVRAKLHERARVSRADRRRTAALPGATFGPAATVAHVEAKQYSRARRRNRFWLTSVVPRMADGESRFGGREE